MVRATRLPAQERRAAIMAATERLIVAEGGEVGTRAIAEAAGIAEGTIFRVFPTKQAIIDAIFEDAFDPETRRVEIGAIDMGLPLDARIVALVAILQRRMRRIQALFSALGFRKPQSTDKKQMAARHERDLGEIVAILEPDRDRLRVPPNEAARLLFSMVMSLTYPMFGTRDPIAPATIVDLLLNGIALPSSPQETPSC